MVATFLFRSATAGIPARGVATHTETSRAARPEAKSAARSSRKCWFQESDRNSQIARSALLPQAGVAASGALNQYNIQSIERAPKREAAGPYQYIQAGPAFSQTILDLPLIRGYQIGREGTHQARADEQTTRENVVNAVVDQYLLILRALATRDAANARVALAQRLYEQATELQKTGIGLNIDTVRANVELQNERQNLIDAETLTHTTKYGLAELLDLPRDQDLEVTDRLDFYDLPALEKEALAQPGPDFAAGDSLVEFAAAHRQVDDGRGARAAASQLDFSGFWFYQGPASTTAFLPTPMQSLWNSRFSRAAESARKKHTPSWKNSTSRKFAASWRRKSSTK